MLYSKGDTVELYGGVMAIILDNGMTGVEFVAQYNGRDIVQLFKNHGSLSRFIVYDGQYMQDHVWYNILTGDTKAWYAVPKKV